MSGFIVKGKHPDTGAMMWLALEVGGYHVIVPRSSQRTTFPTITGAIQAWADAQVMCDQSRIYAVAENGSETPLPTYEEALAQLARIEGVVSSWARVTLSGPVSPRGEGG